jgi:hypothetical protein
MHGFKGFTYAKLQRFRTRLIAPETSAPWKGSTTSRLLLHDGTKGHDLIVVQPSCFVATPAHGVRKDRYEAKDLRPDAARDANGTRAVLG